MERWGFSWCPAGNSGNICYGVDCVNSVLQKKLEFNCIIRWFNSVALFSGDGYRQHVVHASYSYACALGNINRRADCLTPPRRSKQNAHFINWTLFHCDNLTTNHNKRSSALPHVVPTHKSKQEIYYRELGSCKS